MAYTVKPDGSIVCETADEAVALSRALAAAPAPKPVVGESISTDRWQKVHAADKRITAAVERLRAGQEFFGDLTPLQRQACEMRIAGKWPHEIGKELGRTTGTIQAIIWDAGKRLARRAKGEPILTQAEISSMGGKAAKAKRDAAAAPPPPPPPSKPAAAVPPPLPAPAKAARRCGKCGGTGHNARTCVRAQQAHGEIIDESTGAAPDSPGFAPSAEAPGRTDGHRLYVVSEDFEEEDGTAWIEGDVWEALEPTGETVDEHQQWRMQRQGDGAEGVGFPSLHPLVSHDASASARPLHDVTVPRVGMGLKASAAA